MVGWLMPEEGRALRVRTEEREIAGLRLLCARVPLRPGAGRAAAERRVRRAARDLRGAGCRRVLTPPDFPGWPLLEREGLRRVDPGTLCAALAAPLALASLRRRGIPAGEASAALVGNRVDRAFFETACTLCTRVRRLAIRAGETGNALMDFLEREYGVPGLEREEGAQVRLFFTEKGGPEGPGCLSLRTRPPALDGLTVKGPILVPEGLDPLPVLALLREEGRLKCSDLRIILSS